MTLVRENVVSLKQIQGLVIFKMTIESDAELSI
jgi:hypothetical protein